MATGGSRNKSSNKRTPKGTKSITSFLVKKPSSLGSISEVLSSRFGFNQYKSDLQKAVIEKACQGDVDIFVSMPTGAGKSLCFQLPALLSRGITLVFSPLIALIEDQIIRLKEKGIPAEALNSKTLAKERKRILADIQSEAPVIKLLYITPEMAASPHFQVTMDTLYKRKKLSRVAVDEAHCVSEWGHDFRPDYLKLAELRKKYHSIPWMAVTATATPEVQKDIIKNLGMAKNMKVFKTSSFRPNLHYDVKCKDVIPDPNKELVDFIKKSLSLQGNEKQKGCGIIYCRTREGCEELAARLSSKGIKSKAYHAGLKADSRSSVQQQWMDEAVPVIVATISFGMGVDKANVRFVVHWTLPKSMEAYYQESGRAGRDGEPSNCRIYYSKFDRDQLLFLLKKEAARSNMKKETIDGEVYVNKATQDSFKALVDYCEVAQCRHKKIVGYFGDPLPKCEGACDFCADPEGTKEHAEMMKFFGARKELQSTKMGYFEYGKENPELYGGGKWGYKREYDMEETSDNEGSSNRGTKRNVFEDEFFQKEFAKRRRYKSPVTEVVSEDSRLIGGNETAKVNNLTVKVREHCLSLILNAVQNNAEECVCNVNKRQIEKVASQMEHSLLLSSKVVGSYKLAVNKTVTELNNMTSQCQCHPLLEEQKNVVETSVSSAVTRPSGFMKASDLVKLPNSTSTPDVTSSVTDPISDGKLHNGVTPNVSMSNSHWEPTCIDHTDTGPTTQNRVVELDVDFEQPAALLVTSCSQAIAVPSDYTVPVERKDQHIAFGGFKSATSLLKNVDKGKEKARIKVKDHGDSVHIQEAFKPVSVVQGKKLPLRTNQNELTIEERKKIIAKVVVETLTPYLRQQKIASKDLFKVFARKVSAIIMTETHNSTDSKDMTKRAQRKAERVIFSYFSKYSKVQNDVDLKQLDSLLKIS